MLSIKEPFKSFLKVLVVSSLLLIIVIAIPIAIVIRKENIQDEKSLITINNESSQEQFVDSLDSDALKDGNLLSHGNCTGEGIVSLTHSPMNSDDYAYIIPYGLVTGGHVTPIDHQYFSPVDWNSKRDQYPVYALADGVVVDIQHRLNPPNTDEYRIVMMHTCTFFTYFDLMTSLSPELQELFDEKQNNNYASVNFSFVAGQELGRIGTQTLDFAVWNTEHTLEGFVIPSNYDGEIWKVHTDDPYKYYSENIKQGLIDKNLRTVEPIAGKIDHDVEGTIVGNWFITDSGGYTGTNLGTSESDYWDTHLAIVPNHIDPTGYMFSIGDYHGGAMQWGISKSDLSPLEVNLDSGVVRYFLYEVDYIKEDGSSWDRFTLEKGLVFETHPYVVATVLAELVESNELKLEVFEGEYEGGFTEDVRMYSR